MNGWLVSHPDGIRKGGNPVLNDLQRWQRSFFAQKIVISERVEHPQNRFADRIRAVYISRFLGKISNRLLFLPHQFSPSKDVDTN
jgi:hypothetical protein